MSKRATCDTCHYPLKTCVCSAVHCVKNHAKIIILQDKNELKNAKNTARLLALGLSNIEIIQNEDSEALQRLASLCLNEPSSIALIFPSRTSKPFENEKANTTVKNFLFIDATWRKAKRIYLSNEFLQNIPSFHFGQELEGKYRIRKTSIENGLSSLEAVAYVLAVSENTPVTPLYELFEKMQSFWPQPKANS